MGDLSADFNRVEFKCKCGKCNGYPVEPSPQLVGVLQLMRGYAGRQLIISSGVRCMDRDLELAPTQAARAEKLAKPGAHVKGTGADIVAITSRQRYEVVEAAVLADVVRIGINARAGFVHIDVDPDHDQEVLWLYE